MTLRLVLGMAGIMRTLVMPLDDLSPNSHHTWMGESFAEALSSHLGAAGEDVVSAAERERHLEELGLSASAPVTTATVIVMGRELGATRAVLGAYRVEDGVVEVTVKVVDLELGSIVGVIEDHGNVEDLLYLENQVAKNLFRLEGSVPPSFDLHASRRRALAWEAHQKHSRARGSTDPAERRALLESALQIEPSYLEARVFLGRVLLESGEPRLAIEYLSKIQADESVYREAYFLLGLSYLAAGEPAGAIEIFTHLADRESKPAFANNLGVALLRGNRLEPAAAAFARAVELEPDDPRYLFNLGWICWRAGKGSEALRWFRETVRIDPMDAEAHYLLAAAAAAQALPDEADQERELALALSPPLADVDASTVEALERLADRLPPAITLPSDRRVSTESMYEQLVEARAHRAEGRLEEAIREFQRLLYQDPHLLVARLELAEIYSEAGELDKAMSELRVVLWDQESREAHLRLAQIYLKMERHDQARLHVERALEMEPDDPEARKLLEHLMKSESESIK